MMKNGTADLSSLYPQKNRKKLCRIFRKSQRILMWYDDKTNISLDTFLEPLKLTIENWILPICTTCLSQSRGNPPPKKFLLEHI